MMILILMAWRDELHLLARCDGLVLMEKSNRMKMCSKDWMSVYLFRFIE